MADARIFVSHSKKDSAWCRELVGTLQAAGLDVWYDEKGLSAGAAWVATIERELQSREVFLVVLTPNAWASEWVQEEIQLALAQRRRIIPVLHEPTQVAGFLMNRQWIDAISLDAAHAAERILDALGVSLTRPAVPAQPSPQPSVAARPAAPVAAPSPAAPSRPTDSSIVPQRLASLGFAGYRNGSVGYIVPPVVAVPAGEFLMGSDPKRDSGAYDSEKPQRKLSLPGFQIAKFPVTVAEYACFVRSGQREPTTSYLSWKTQLEQRADHPVVNVSWQDAVAYAAWLAQQSGQPWRLPSEAEWEKAARGADGRIYPWGDRFDKGRANTSEGGKGTTTPVSSYASGASPYGAQDMSGNVWEWTSSLFKPYPYTPSDGREDLNSTENRVLRGGSWNYHSRNARAAFRNVYRPVFLNGNIGFRVVLAVPSS